MASDGHIDYGHYTKPQLREALGSIDRSLFPLNFNALQRELTKREQEPSGTPQTPESLTSTRKPKSRWPVLVRIILVVYVVVLVLTIPSTIALLAGMIKMPPVLARYVAAQDFWDYACAGIGLVLSAALVVSLYRMRRSALYLAIAAFLNHIVSVVLSYEDLRELGQGPLQLATGPIIAALVAYYLWRLSKKGLLA